jgi:HEAT repeat protein
MTGHRLSSSVPVLLTATVLFTGALLGAIFPASAHIIGVSSSIVANFYVIGGLMLLVILASAAQGFLWIRLIWGPRVASDLGKPVDDEEDDLKEVRAMRVTGTKKAAVLLITLAVNTAVFDYLGHGVLISDIRAIRVMTLLRSSDGQDRADAVNDAIILVGDERVAASLKRVIDTPGEAREWAVYAAGVRGDQPLADSVVHLLRTGNERERAAAAVALARMKDHRLVQYAKETWPKMGALRGDLVKALGTLGRTPTMSKRDLKTAGEFLTSLLEDKSLGKALRRVVIWAIGRFNAPEGLLAIERLLDSGTDTATMCAGLEAVGRIGSASSSPRLVEAIHTFDKNTQCPETTFEDFTGDEVLITERINLIERLLRDIAAIGDRRARPEMEKLAKNQSFSPAVRSLAGEIAFQMKYKPLDTAGH